MFVVIDGAIFEFWYDRLELIGPTRVSEKYTDLRSFNSSVAFQREMDTPQGHRPETVTVVFRINSGKILTRVWTNATKEWRGGASIVVPQDSELLE